jgi:hypothetical protein
MGPLAGTGPPGPAQLGWPGSRSPPGEESEATHLTFGHVHQISGIDKKGARVIEVWRSAGAQAFAEKSRPFLAAAELSAPSRVVGFEVTSYVVS